MEIIWKYWKYLFLGVFCLPVETIIGKSFCQDTCAIEKAEKSLKLALGIVKMIQEDIQNNTDDDDEATLFPFNLTTESPLGEGYTPINSLPFIEYNGTDNISVCNRLPSNCADIITFGFTKSGIYEIYPKWVKNPKASKVYCDLTSEGGGWTIIQRRNDYHSKTHQSFNKTWIEYKKGFGVLEQEFWLGNDLISNLTTQDRMILLLEVEDWEGQKRFAHYKGFLVQKEETNYTMTYTSHYDSTIGSDHLSSSNNNIFRTPDRDDSKNKPAVVLGTGFWFRDYTRSSLCINPNGVYYEKGNHLNKVDGIFAQYFRGQSYSVKRFEMKLRPEYFVPFESTI